MLAYQSGPTITHHLITTTNLGQTNPPKTWLPTCTCATSERKWSVAPTWRPQLELLQTGGPSQTTFLVNGYRWLSLLQIWDFLPPPKKKHWGIFPHIRVDCWAPKSLYRHFTYKPPSNPKYLAREPKQFAKLNLVAGFNPFEKYESK